MSVRRITDRPPNTRSVPLLTDPDVGHYPEFRSFLSETFGLAERPLDAPGLLEVDGRVYELVFIGRSGRPFPAAVEIAALATGLEPLDVDQADRDLWRILEWLVEGVGPPWDVETLATTGQIYRAIPRGT